MSRKFLLALLALAAVALFGCSDDEETTNPVDTTPPSLASVTPASGAVDVNLLQGFTFVFDEALDPTTLNDTTVTTATRGGGLHVVPAADNLSVWVAPDSLWTPESAHQIVIDGATDLAGNALPTVTTTFTTAALSCASLADRFEVNNDIASATTCAVDVAYPALSVCDADRDFYVFTLTEAAKVTARTDITYAEATSWQLYWQRENGDAYGTLGTTVNSGGEPSYHYSFLPGTYYLSVREAGDTEHVLYDLILETSEPCAEDAYEDNDFEDIAAPITVGLHEDLRGCYVDADWYAFAVEAGQTITLTVTSDPYEGFDHRRLRIREPGGQMVSYDGSANPATTSVVAAASGTATAMARFWVDDVVYDMEIALTNE